MRKAALGVVLMILFPLQAGCVYPRRAAEPAITTAFDRPTETQLGRSLGPRVAAHAGSSGIYVLHGGLDAFAARIGLIERAELALDLQVYIFHDDVTGRLVLGRLLAAAERGVRVRVLLDDLGTSGIDSLLAAADAHPRLEVRLFNPFARGPLPRLARMCDVVLRMRLLNRRMHNKLITADGAAGIVGGRNVGDEYFDAREGVNFADLDLLAVGPVVRELGESFDLYWNSSHAVPLAAWRGLRKQPADLARLRVELDEHLSLQQASPYAERLNGSDLVQAAAAGELPLLWAPVHAVADLPRKINARGDEVAETLLTERMGPLLPEASSELLIVSPYFVPRDAGVARLVALAARGVRVRILTNSLAATDVGAVHAGYSSCRRELLAAGVELYELRPSGSALAEGHRRGLFGSSQASLHAKTFTIDRGTVFVGSLNLDPRSVVLNTELGLVVDSTELAADMVRSFELMTAPEFSYRVALEPGGSGPELVWHGAEAGEALVFHVEPDTSWWQRFRVRLLGVLPIEGQL
jgi:cardiolipin synthase C